MNKYINSDLAVERKGLLLFQNDENSCYTEEEKENVSICRLRIDSEASSKKYSRAKGNYITIFSEKIWLMDTNKIEKLAKIISSEIKGVLTKLFPNVEYKKLHILVAGLGNMEITADSIGPLSIRQMTVTRHLQGFLGKLFCENDIVEVSAILPGVLSQTGIETVEIIKSVVNNIKPDAVIAIDALAARSCDRLGTTIQISDNGISPGSGIGNMQKAINATNVGVPVIAIGIPTVVNSSTLVYDVLENAGINEIRQEIIDVLNSGKDFFVSPKEIDIIIKNSSELLSMALDMVFGTWT